MVALPQLFREEEEVESAEQIEERERSAFLEALMQEAGPVVDDSPASLDAYIDTLLERLRDREVDIRTNDEIAERRIAMIEGWRLQVNRSAEREAQWIRQQVVALAAGYEFGKKKSRTLPNGSFGFRSSQDKIEITDPAAALVFAETHGLEVKKSVGVTPLKEYFKATGEIPDGCEFVAGEEVPFVKAAI